jgi:hypothetical protein
LLNIKPRDLYAAKLWKVLYRVCKELEVEYKSDLELNLEASRKKSLDYYYSIYGK